MRAYSVVAALSLMACGGIVPPQPAQPRDATVVAASVGRTWDAVIDAFAASNIPIKNMERVSGFISTDPLAVGRDAAKSYANCGSVIGMPIVAERATYNVTVRGDSTHATVRATVHWTSATGSTECATRGTWETEFETRVKSQAEGK